MKSGKQIKAICSAGGPYFEIGIAEDGTYYLSNNLTEIPNEFHLYDEDKVKELFFREIEHLQSCVPVEECEHYELCEYAVYDDGSRQLFEDKDTRQMAYIGEVTKYSELYDREYYGKSFSIYYIRKACLRKRVDFQELFDKVQYMLEYEDDYASVKSVVIEGGSIAIEEEFYGRTGHRIVISPDRTIMDAGGIIPVEILKKEGVKVIGIPRQL